MTSHFSLLFMVGFGLHASVFVNQTYVDPCFRGAFVKNRGDVRAAAMISLIIEWLLHIAVVSFSAMVLFLTEYGKASGGAAECMGEHQLGPEKQWLTILAIA